MNRIIRFGIVLSASLVLLACGSQPGSPVAPGAPASQETGLEGGSEAATPYFNLEVVLRGNGFGLVKFRQPKDDEFVVHLDTWVRDLQPNTSYRLQRAVDTTLDGACTSADWLTLGKGLVPQTITTDDRGTGREALWRAVPPMAGMEFDIHFRVIKATTGEVVLTSDCYQYTISL